MLNVKDLGKNGINEKFDEMMDRMTEDDRGKFDFRATYRNIEFNDQNGKFVITDAHTGDEREFGLTSNAYSQIMNKIGIPASYAKKTPNSLIKPHFDYWKHEMILDDPDRELLIRAKHLNNGNDTVRAFLSSDYNILDNKDVIAAFRKSLDKSKYSVIDYEIDDDMFNVRLLFNDLTYDNNIASPNGKPNKFWTGLHITNGETGNYKVLVDLILFEQWCANGAIRRFNGKSILDKKHAGTTFSLEERFPIALDGIHNKADETMHSFVDTMKTTILNPMETLRNLMDRNKPVFTDDIQKKVMDAFENRPYKSMYGIISALTKAAQLVPYERRLDIERIAGNLIKE